MNATSGATGLEGANASSAGDHGSDTFRVLAAARAALEARGCWRLAREIADEVARWEAEINPPKRFIQVGEGERGGETTHGPAPGDAEEVT